MVTIHTTDFVPVDLEPVDPYPVLRPLILQRIRSVGPHEKVSFRNRDHGRVGKRRSFNLFVFPQPLKLCVR